MFVSGRLPRHSESLTISSTPDVLYDMISDVTRMGEWSPVCKLCWWDDGSEPRAGQWFTGHNESDGQVWETRCEIEVAKRGREFTFVVGGVESGSTRWRYTFASASGGTEVTESWQVLPGWLVRAKDKSEDEVHQRLSMLEQLARTGMSKTLDALKRAAEVS
jgi:hypothetical protein